MPAKAPLIFAALFLASGTAQAAEGDKERIAEGRRIAERICSTCHAIGPEGASPHVDAPPLRVIAGEGPVENLEEALGEGIVVGHPDMPQFKFNPHQVGAITAYLKTLRQRT